MAITLGFCLHMNTGLYSDKKFQRFSIIVYAFDAVFAIL